MDIELLVTLAVGTAIPGLLTAGQAALRRLNEWRARRKATQDGGAEPAVHSASTALASEVHEIRDRLADIEHQLEAQGTDQGEDKAR